MNVREVSTLLARAELLNMVPRESDGARLSQRAIEWQKILVATSVEEADIRLSRIAADERRAFTLHPGALAVQQSSSLYSTGAIAQQRAEAEATRRELAEPGADEARLACMELAKTLRGYRSTDAVPSGGTVEP